MLRPNKHSDPRLTVLPVAAALLAELRRIRIASLTQVKSKVLSLIPEAEPLFAPAVYTLFLLDLVVYRRKTDSLEYIGP